MAIAKPGGSDIKRAGASFFTLQITNNPQQGRTFIIELGRSFGVAVVVIALIIAGASLPPATSVWIKTLIALVR
jgi:hypothetical protein